MPDKKLPPLRALLVFNPASGLPADAPARLMSILSEMQAWNIMPQVCLLTPELDLKAAVEDALSRGIRLFVACGGDGTIDSVASLLAGTRAMLGAIPAGTRNNVALSLNLPRDIPGAVAVLRTGRAVKVDMGFADCPGSNCPGRPFLEICTVGLLSALFPAADDVQHGNLTRLGDLLATLVSFPPAEMRLFLDKRTRFSLPGHVVLVGNMPYAGPNYPVAASAVAATASAAIPVSAGAGEDAYCDGLLDLLVFSSISKLDLLGAALQTAGGGVDDPRIQRYQVKEFEIETDPPMPVMADGFQLGDTPLRIRLKRRALTMLVSASA